MFDADVEDLAHAPRVEHDPVLGLVRAVTLHALIGSGVGATGDVADDDHVGRAGNADRAHADAQVEQVPQRDQGGFRVRALLGADAGMRADGTGQHDVGLAARRNGLVGQRRSGHGPPAGAIGPRPGELDRRAVGGEPAQEGDGAVEDLGADPVPGQQGDGRHGSSRPLVWVVMIAVARSTPTRISSSCNHGPTAASGPG